nr:MFS transporter [Actinomycetes bacterium]
RALTSARVWTLALIIFGIAYGVYTLAFFLPSIISGFQTTFGVGYSIVEVGLITAIPYTFAAVAMYVWSRHADRTGEHVWHVAIPAFVGGLAIPAALYLNSPVLVMIPVVITAMAIYCAIPCFWALPSHFLTGTAAAAAIALINSIGNLAGFAGPYVTGALHDATGSDKLGLWAVGAMMMLSGVLVIVLRAAPNPDRQAASAA